MAVPLLICFSLHAMQQMVVAASPSIIPIHDSLAQLCQFESYIDLVRGTVDGQNEAAVLQRASALYDHHDPVKKALTAARHPPKKKKKSVVTTPVSPAHCCFCAYIRVCTFVGITCSGWYLSRREPMRVFGVFPQTNYAGLEACVRGG